MIKKRNKRSKKESPKRKDLSDEHINSLKKSRENRLNPRSRMVCFDGLLFETIKDFAEAYGYDASTVCSWLTKRYEPVNKAFITVRYATELDLKNKNNVKYDKSMGRLKQPVFDWSTYFNAEVREEEQELDRYYGLDDVSIRDGDNLERVIHLGSKDECNKDVDEELFDCKSCDKDDSFDYIEDDYIYDDFEIG